MSEFEEFKEFLPDQTYQPSGRERIKHKRASVIDYLPSAILTVMLIVLSGLGTLLQYDMDFKSIIFSAFIVSLSLRLTTMFSAKYVGSNLYYNRAIYSDNVVKLKDELTEVGAEIDKSELEKYVNAYNLESKKKAYKLKKRSKIAKLETRINKFKFKNQLRYRAYREKLMSKWSKKIEELEEISTDEYVEKNIIYMRVKYSKVRTCYFFSSAENNAVKDRNYNVNVSKVITKEIAKSMPLTIFISLFGSTIVFSVSTGTFNVVSFIYDLTMILFNFILGWFVIGKKTIAATISAFINRIVFLKEYKRNEKTQTQDSQALAVAAENCA